MPVTLPLVDTLPSSTNRSLLTSLLLALLPSLLPPRLLLSQSLMTPSLLAVANNRGSWPGESPAGVEQHSASSGSSSNGSGRKSSREAELSVVGMSMQA